MFNKKNDIFTDHGSFLQKRRELYLDSQLNSRTEILSKARGIEKILKDFDEDISLKELSIWDFDEITKDPASLINDLSLMDEEKDLDPAKNEDSVLKVKKAVKYKKKLLNYSKIFSFPEHMFTIPLDLNTEDWLLIPRPEGTHCLLIARNGFTYLRDKNGFVMKKFNSGFPGGSASTKKGSTLLEVILDKDKKYCFLLDILFWNEQNLLECSSEARYFWLESHVASIKHTQSLDIEFLRLPKLSCDTKGFNMAYKANFGFTKDGILFVAKKGLYLPGVNPYFLLWKDNICSEYLPINEMSEVFSGVLIIAEKGYLKTLDGVILGHITKEEMLDGGLKKGDLVKVEILEQDLAGLKFLGDETCFLFEKLKVLEKTGFKRALPDSLSKFLFAYYYKYKPLSMLEIENYLKNS